MLNQNVAIPFFTKGTIIGFDSVMPSSEDLSMYPHIELTSDVPWDPRNVQLAALSHEHLYNNESYGVNSKIVLDTSPEDP